MRSKRLLAMLLALCLVLSAFSPAAMAVEADNGTVTKAPQNASNNATNKTTASSYANEHLISADDANGVNTLRDIDVELEEVQKNETEGGWEFAPTQKPEASVSADAPACLEELKQAAELYDANEAVIAVVVMEDAPLAMSHSSIDQVPASAEKLLIEKQDAVISSIEKNVLGGEKLEVRYQFTYLTNAFTVKTAFANLEKIAVMDGVQSVAVMPVFEAVPTATATPNTAASGAMTGVNSVWEDLGYSGEGMKIAIVDTGLDLDHPSFAAAPEGAAMDAAEIEAVLEDLWAYKLRSGNLDAEDLYRSEKVPYAFNYVDRNLNADHSKDMQGDHGTHVAGIAAANPTEGTSVVGMAPNAQIIVMKVFGAAGGAYTDDFVAAIEDAMILGCDVVNLSLGSPAGFTDSGYAWYDSVFQMLETQNIIATISAGNETNSSYGNLWGTDLNRTDNPENGVVGSPSTYVNAFSIASAENSVVMTEYFSLADGSKVFYMNSVEYLYGETYSCLRNLAGEELEYVIVPGLGDVADFYDEEGNSIVEGKVAIVSRGTLAFSEKILNAQDAGAVAAIIWNNNDTDDIFSFGMTTATEEGLLPAIPAALITLADGQKMADAETKTMTVSPDLGERLAEGGQMSSFSSWGTTSDLRLVPDITGIGGNVYSTLDGGVYGLMSGTSMSAPQIAGVSALVMQYLYEKYPDAEAGEIREMAMALMMSTADPVTATASGLEASPRQQGAGLVDAAEAVTTPAYLTVNGDRPKIELGDSSTGVYTLNFEIHNVSDADQTYTLSSSLLTEDIVDYGIEQFMAGYERELTGNVYFNHGDSVTVPAGETVKVTVTVSLSAEDMEYFDAYWENGGYVEGYLYLDETSEEGPDLNLPFLGFYGDWTEAPVFDSAYWYDNTFWSYASVDGLPEGDQYYHVMWTDLGGTDWVLGMNPYSGALLDENGNVIYDPYNNVLSPNGDGVQDGITEVYLSLLRNAKVLTFSYSVEGEVVYEEIFENAPKTMYRSNYGQIVPWLSSWYSYAPYDYTDAEGNPLPNGTKIDVSITGTVDYGDGGDHAIEFPIYIDTAAPELVNVYELPQADGTQLLAVEVSENHSLAAALALNSSGTRVLASAYEFGEATNNGTVVAYLDITNLGNEFTLVLGDYGGNESYYEVTYTANDNKPVMDTNLLYAYRVNDSIIGQYMGYDYQFGWVSMNKPEDDTTGYNASWIESETEDYMEYYAITAAEYAGGKIFAVDAGNNFLVLDPGLWNRQTVAALDMGVADMAFDDTTDTMYMLGVDEYDYIYLQTVDLLTGETTTLKTYYWGDMPWSLTIDENGTIYAIARYGSNLFTIDKENGYSMVAVTDENGDPIVLTDSYGDEVYPAYSQSMTYVDGKIYWAYFYGGWQGNYAELIMLDPANGYAATYAPYITTYPALGGMAYSDTELVGLLTLDETEYTIPEATELESIWLQDSRLILNTGATERLVANATPWNYELTGLTYATSDESVVTVDADGNLTAVAEGNAVVTVSAGDLTAECLVTVVSVEGTFNAYNYYSNDGYYGYMIEVDMETMDYGLTALSPVDFIAGDYNGHEGVFYGYAEGGQLYRYDMEAGTAEPVGAATGVNPVDMAYDYTTGFMYAASLDYNTGVDVLYAVDMNSGNLVELGQGYGGMMTLACDGEGNLFSILASGELVQVHIIQYEDWMTGELVTALEYEYIIEESLGYLQYAQSMCYDHANDVLLWAYPEQSVIYWIDHNNEVAPYALNLGDPTESGLFEFLGMYTVPAEMPALPEVAVESVEAEDMFMLVGDVKTPAVSVMPLNANGYTVNLTSSDESVVVVTEDGTLSAVSAGEAVVTVEVVDAYSDAPLTATVNVQVIPGADNLYGHVVTDIATYGGSYWIDLPTNDPKNPVPLAPVDYTLFAEEYYNGMIYAVGYSNLDYSAAWDMLIVDAETFEVLETIPQNDAYPFVYDMTYDYTTSTMYAVAGAGSEASDLYVMDMETGALTLLMQTEQFFMSLAAGPDGKLYAIEKSLTSGDSWDPWAPVETLPADIYVIDPIEGTVELLGSTGVVLSSLASLTYDYDTDYLYWTPLDQSDYSGGLAVVDPATGEAHVLDTIGAMGAQVTGLFAVCDSFPAESENVLHKLLVNPAKTSLTIGETVELSAVTLPMSLDAEITWTSSDESVAVVGQNGVVTALAQGTTVITVTATCGDVTMTATCELGVLSADASFLTYNVTDGTWSAISRADLTNVTNLSEPSEDAAVSSLAAVGTSVYGYDVENSFFSLSLETYERTTLGTVNADEVIQTYLDNEGVEDDVANYMVEVRDLAYDSANDRVLALGVIKMYDSWFDGYYEIYNGAGIYEVDLTDGSLKHLYTITAHSTVMAMDVDDEGIVYYYNAYDDFYTVLDLETGAIVNLVSMQTQSVYGDTESSHDLFYDELTGMLYHLFTSNGNYYRMWTVDPSTGALTNLGNVGEVVYNSASWSYNGDILQGLVFVNGADLAPSEPVVPDAEIVAVSTSMNGNIGLNFYATLSEEMAADETVYMQFTVDGEFIEVPLSAAKVVTSNGVTQYRFTCELAAAEMTELVVAQVCNGSGTVSESVAYSVQKYADKIIANYDDEATVTLMEAMLNYGAYAQIHFEKNVDALANANLADTSLPETVDVSAYAHSFSGTADGLTVQGYSLLMQSETTLRVYFTLAEGKSIEDYVLTVDGETVTAVADGSRYYVEKTGIAAPELDEMYEFNLGGFVLNCSGLSYVNTILNNEDLYEEDVLDLVKALYVYNQAANAYFG